MGSYARRSRGLPGTLGPLSATSKRFTAAIGNVAAAAASSAEPQQQRPKQDPVSPEKKVKELLLCAPKEQQEPRCREEKQQSLERQQRKQRQRQFEAEVEVFALREELKKQQECLRAEVERREGEERRRAEVELEMLAVRRQLADLRKQEQDDLTVRQHVEMRCAEAEAEVSSLHTRLEERRQREQQRRRHEEQRRQRAEQRRQESEIRRLEAEAEAASLRGQLESQQRRTAEAEEMARLERRRRQAVETDFEDHPFVVEYKALAEATRDFDAGQIIGRGGFGAVFRGVLRGREVAVKVAGPSRWTQSFSEFQRELQVLAACRHRNILPLHAFSLEPRRPFCLVYPFMPNGSLSDVLLDNDRSRELLPAHRRVCVARDVAAGIDYLHKSQDGVKKCIVHRDVKSANVLLGSEMEARLSDVGLARDMDHGPTQTRIIGTPGYLDPEYTATEVLTVGSDIFSLGVVLLELLTGQPPVDPTQCPQALHARLRGRLPGDAALLADRGAEFSHGLAEGFGALLTCCLAPTAKARPALADVISNLDGMCADAFASRAAVVGAPAARECVVCWNAPRATRLTPCLHAILCLPCATELLGRESRCPTCRLQIESFEEGVFEHSYTP